MLVEVMVCVAVTPAGNTVDVIVLLAVFVFVEVALGRVVVRVFPVTVTVTVVYGWRVWVQLTAFGDCAGVTAWAFAFWTKE